MNQLVVGQNDAGQRLDKFLFKALPRLPASLLYKSIRKKDIRLNGKRCEIGTKLVAGDLLRLYLPDEFFIKEEATFLLAPAQVNIVYEDKHVLLVDKPAGLLVHEDAQESNDTLVHRIQHYLYNKGEYDPQKENGFAPALCNRIDRNTCGIVIAAKDFETLQFLSEKIRAREISKQYICIVHGTPTKQSGILKGYHIKDSATNTVRILHKPVPESKTALTKYRVLHSNEKLSLLEVELLTGRTHQIRAHMASIGHPLAGETKYGLNRMNRTFSYPYQALCSYQVTFSFSTDSGHMEYLKNRSFSVDHIPFLSNFGFENFSHNIIINDNRKDF